MNIVIRFTLSRSGLLFLQPIDIYLSHFVYHSHKNSLIENEGQHSSLQLFVQLITLFDISADQYIFPDTQTLKSTQRRRIDALLNKLDDMGLTIVEGTATTICKIKEQTEG